MKHCPRDHSWLASNEEEGCRHDSCEKCDGVWIPGTTLRVVLNTESLQRFRATRKAEKEALICPSCKNGLSVVVIEACELDVCEKCHGVWLDSREITDLSEHFRKHSALLTRDNYNSESPVPTTAVFLDAITQVVAALLK